MEPIHECTNTHIHTQGTGTHICIHACAHTHTPFELPMGTNTTCHLLTFSMQMIMTATISGGFPDGSNGKESACNAGDLSSTLVFLPGVFHGLRSLVGYSPWGRKETDRTE